MPSESTYQPQACWYLRSLRLLRSFTSDVTWHCIWKLYSWYDLPQSGEMFLPHLSDMHNCELWIFILTTYSWHIIINNISTHIDWYFNWSVPTSVVPSIFTNSVDCSSPPIPPTRRTSPEDVLQEVWKKRSVCSWWLVIHSPLINCTQVVLVLPPPQAKLPF